VAQHANRTTLLGCFALAAALLSFFNSGQAEDGVHPAQAPAAGAIHFTNGDFAAGQLLDSAEPDVIRWQSPAFSGELKFPAQVVQSIELQQTVEPRDAGPYFFELAGGDTISGELIALDGQKVVIKTPGLGVLTVNRAVLRRFFRSVPGEVLFAGPGSLASWKTFGPAKGWREEASHLVTNKSDAELTRSFSLPRVARYELELSWPEQPSFEFAVGIDKDRPKLRPHFKLETWGSDLVIVRESERTADFRSLQKLPAGPGRLNLQIIFDRTQGRVIVFSPTGERLANLEVPPDAEPQSTTIARAKPTLFKLPAAANVPAGGVQLLYRRGNLKFERR